MDSEADERRYGKLDAITVAENGNDHERRERKNFEAWFEAAAMPLESDWFRSDGHGGYDIPRVDVTWRAWQARAKDERIAELDAELERAQALLSNAAQLLNRQADELKNAAFAAYKTRDR